MRHATLWLGIVMSSVALGATSASAQVGKAALVSPGKTSAFANARNVGWSLFDPVTSVDILRAKAHSVLHMEATIATSGSGANPSSFGGAIYVEDEASGHFVVPPQTLGGQTCPAGVGGNCTLSFTAFLDLDDPDYAFLVNKRATIELFALAPPAENQFANVTLAVQLLRK